jgi:hypothetical protein
MNFCSIATLAFATVSLASPLPAQASVPRYQFVPGETLRYLIQRDPYFADPKAAIEKVSGEDYRPPIVERLTEKVLSVAPDGTATLKLTLAPEPGFEDDTHPQAAISRTVTVTATGHIVSVLGMASRNSPPEQDLMRGLVSLAPILSMRKDGLAVETRQSPLIVTRSTSPDHDGTLLQTTTATRSNRLVFDCRQGQLVREISTETLTLSLVMTGRGRRGSDDFGHVIPNSTVVQTLTIERCD